MNEMILLFFRLPFENKPYIILSINGNIRKGKDIIIPKTDVGITINLWDYLSNSDDNYNLPKKLFDLNLARRLLTGKSKDCFPHNNEPWNGISILGRNFADSKIFSSIKAIENNQYATFSEWESNLPNSWEILLIESIKKEYDILSLELKRNNLYDYFIKIEMSLLVSFAKSGCNGININYDLLNKRCLELDNIYYNTVRELEITHNFVVSDYKAIKFEDIKNFIKVPFDTKVNDKYLWDYIELHKNISTFLEQLYLENHVRRDLTELLRIKIGLSDKCKLQYDIIGTVSGRILVTRPGIQYLKRTSRDVFIPNPGHKFIYADYSQFEPGILAFLSEDKNLIHAYTQGDLYDNLAKKIGNSCSREIAKKMFLSYIYGMNIENIKKSIVNTYGESAEKSIEIFFNNFPKVLSWKKSIVENSFRDKKATGLTGYIRYFDENEEKYDIARLAPNHIIQATASGIFKNALVNYTNASKNGRLLVPMHDAVLIEVISEEYECEKKLIFQCMKQAFESLSNGMECKIHYDNFSG